MQEPRITYLNLGIQTLPTQENKSPAYGVNWREDVHESKFKDAYGIGLKCGECSNGLECLDFDNHFGNAEDICQDFLSDDFLNSMLGTKLFVESTKSGGYHLVFFSDYYEGNQKLAREEHNGIVKTVIETRGDGGYFCAYPTPGYDWSRYSLYDATKIERLTKEERDYLISTAKTFNKFVADNHFSSSGTGVRVGDLYNEDTESKYEALELLKSNGWTIEGKKLTRPGKSKKDGISATFGHVADNVLYVFSSNAYPFEENHAYRPFQIKAFLQHGGDFKSCAKELAERYAPQVSEIKETQKISEMEELLKSLRIDTTKQLEKPKTILSVTQRQATQTEEIPIFHLADFSVLIGKQKSKKTFLTSVIASTLAGSTKHSKLSAETHNGKDRIVFFDTEQGDFYAQKTARRINYEVGRNVVDYFALRELDHYKRRDVIEFYLKTNYKIGFVALDGVVDLLYDFNNQEESAKLVQWIMRLTKQYNVHFLNIIHQNKADGHARGHLGTMLSQKAETVIEIKKNENNTNSSLITSIDTRGKNFEPFQIIIDGNGNPHLDEIEEYKSVF